MWEEEMFLGLRKTKGVSVAHFSQKFGESPLVLFKDEISQLEEKDLIKVSDGYIFLTYRGRFLGNEVFQAFL
jgi:coproporphyrinogen III oxidase-like Fe-S oxidoreductase